VHAHVSFPLVYFVNYVISELLCYIILTQVNSQYI